MRYSFLSFTIAGALLMGSGCSSITMKTWVKPGFKISRYKKAFIKEDQGTEGFFYNSFENYLESIKLIPIVYSPKKKITKHDIIVDLKTEWGLSRPYGRPIPHNFKYPDMVSVEFFDGITKEKLLKVVYKRSLDADITGEDGRYTAIIIKYIDKALGFNKR